MSKTQSTIDVFISGSLSDSEHVAFVADALERAGLGVYRANHIRPAGRAAEDIRAAIAEASAFVLVMNPEHGVAANVAVELGAAMAWHKQVFVVLTARPTEVPDYLAHHRQYSISRIDDVAQAILEGRKPLSERERDILASIYAQTRVPTDRLIRDPAVIDSIAREFDAKATTQVSGERLVRELIRMRKTGRLPKLRRRRSTV